MAIDRLNLKLLFVAILQVLTFDFKKFSILEVLKFHPSVCQIVKKNNAKYNEEMFDSTCQRLSN